MSQIALTMENITTFLITSSTISGKKKKSIVKKPLISTCMVSA